MIVDISMLNSWRGGRVVMRPIANREPSVKTGAEVRSLPSPLIKQKENHMDDLTLEDFVNTKQIDIPIFSIKEIEGLAEKFDISLETFIITSLQIIHNVLESSEAMRPLFVKKATEYDMIYRIIVMLKDNTNSDEWKKIITMSKEEFAKENNDADLDEQLSSLFR